MICGKITDNQVHNVLLLIMPKVYKMYLFMAPETVCYRDML